jgi:sugar lactone lactonase YvrE
VQPFHLGTITTVAGTGAEGPVSSVGSFPTGVALDGNRLYVADPNGSVVRLVDLGTGAGRVFAGSGALGDSGDGGPATQAQLEQPFAIALGPGGTLYIADYAANRVRAVTRDGVIHTIAGTGKKFNLQAWQDGVPAVTADLELPSAVAADRAGNVYVSEGSRVARITPAGIITTLTKRHGSGLAVDATGDVYLAETQTSVVSEIRPDGSTIVIAGTGHQGFTGDGGPATSANLTYPVAVAIDSAGDIFIGDSTRIRKVGVDHRMSTIAGTGEAGFSGDGFPALVAKISNTDSLAVDGGGVVYFADSSNGRIRRVTADGIIRTLPGINGDGAPAATATLAGPTGLAFGQDGSLYVAERDGERVRRIDPSGRITTVAGNGVIGFGGDGGSAVAAELDHPTAIALDGSGNLFIADSKNNRVRRVDRGGRITTVAGSGTPGFGGDGGPATAAMLNEPAGLAIDRDGAVLVADSKNSCVRRIDADGVIKTIAGHKTDDDRGGFAGDGGQATAALLGWPQGIAVDGSGSIYIADPLNGRVRRVDRRGVITTAAGGDITALAFPIAVVADVQGYIYIADLLAQRVRRLDSHGGLDTVAGSGPLSLDGGGYSGDGGPATLARLNNPTGVAISMAGNLVIADTDNGRLRQVVLRP